MTLTKTDIQALRTALEPDFKRLEHKMDRGFRANHKDHNLILQYLDRQDARLGSRIKSLEDKMTLLPFKSL